MDTGSIDLGERAGRDMGDLGKLMASIAAEGLIHDITVTPEGRLVLGARRLKACKRLGWRRIPATVVTKVQEALDRIDRDKQGAQCVHPLTVIEAIRVDIAVRELEWWPRDGSTVTAGRRDLRREMLAGHFGLNGRQYAVARRLVLATDGWREHAGTRYPISAEAQERAKAALAIINTPSDLNAALRLYQTGVSEWPPAPSHGPRRLPSRGQEASIESALAALAGITAGLSRAAVADLEIPAGVLRQWDRDFGSVIRALIKFRKEVQRHDGYRNGDNDD